MRNLFKGRYYWHRDSSIKGIHPAYIYEKNDKKNRYNVICFTTTKGRRRTKLHKNIDPNSNADCYVLNRPRVTIRKRFANELKGYKVTDYRDKALIKTIQNKKRK